MDTKQQAPFSFPENFSPAKMLTEDTDSRSKGNAFDLSIRAKEKEPKFKNHDMKKVSTGTVFTRKSETFGKDAPAGADTSKEGKRGRGRPPGKYGSYKKRIKEALENHSVVSKEQLDELSKTTLGDYIWKNRSNSIDLQKAKDENEAHKRRAMDIDYGSDKEASKAVDSVRKALTKSSDKIDKKMFRRSLGAVRAVNRLTKEDIDQMSHEEFDDLVENFDQLDELSQETLKSYVKKASKDKDNLEKNYSKKVAKGLNLKDRIEVAREKRNISAQKGKGSGRLQSDAEIKLYGKQDQLNQEKQSISKNIKNRTSGINKATNRLTKESFEMGDRVQAEGKQGIVEHVIGSDIHVRLEEGLRRFNVANVTLVPNVVTVDNTLLEGVSWDRWNSVHELQEKENIGTWMVSLNESGYKYGHKEGEDYITVKGNGLDVAMAAKQLSEENNATVYILEAFTPEADKDALSLTKIVQSAFSVK